MQNTVNMLFPVCASMESQMQPRFVWYIYGTHCNTMCFNVHLWETHTNQWFVMYICGKHRKPMLIWKTQMQPMLFYVHQWKTHRNQCFLKYIYGTHDNTNAFVLRASIANTLKPICLLVTFENKHSKANVFWRTSIGNRIKPFVDVHVQKNITTRMLSGVHLCKKNTVKPQLCTVHLWKT